jgi:hypothetical protein
VLNVHLPTSRRSLPEILNFVDSVFAQEAAAADASRLSGQAPRPQGTVGLVELWPTVPYRILWLDLAARGRRGRMVPSSSCRAALTRSRNGSTVAYASPATKQSGQRHQVLLPRREPFANEIIRRLSAKCRW